MTSHVIASSLIRCGCAVEARDLGDRLLRAFNTPSGIPNARVDLGSGAAANYAWTGQQSVLAELGTLQVEMRYLSQATGDPKYAMKANKVYDILSRQNVADGLAPIYVNPSTGQFASSRITFGALGDSYYEYLLKVWIQGGKRENRYRRMYDAAMDGVHKRLLKRTSPSRLAYVSDLDGGRTVDKMDHLVCFLPGVMALGAKSKPDSPNAARDLRTAKQLTYTCYQMYARHPTGLSPEYVTFGGGGEMQAAFNAAFYILRPEASEAMFVLNQLTGHPVYREWGWEMFKAINKNTRAKYAYGHHPDVRNVQRVPEDRMESFFLAETLKYLYMLQAPLSEHKMDLTKYVFGTEAHPMSVFTKEGAGVNRDAYA